MSVPVDLGQQASSGDSGPGGEGGRTAGSRSRRTRIVVTAVGTALIAGAAGGAIAYVAHRNEAERKEAVASAQAQYAAAVAAEAEQDAAQAPAAELLTATESQVADDGTRVRLEAAIRTAGATDVPDAATADDATTEVAHGALGAAATATEAITTATAELNDAVAAVTASHDRYLLDQATQRVRDAKAAARSAVDAGEQTLTKSEGRVDDNAVRQALRDELDKVVALVAAPDEGTVQALGAQAAALNEAAGTVAPAQTAVTDAVRARDHRIAAEAAARAAAEKKAQEEAAARTRSSSSSSTKPSSGTTSRKPSSSGSTSKSSGGSSSGSSGGTSIKPPPVPPTPHRTGGPGCTKPGGCNM